MAQYGELRVDLITYTTGVGGGEANHTITVSSLVNAPTFSGDVVITGDLDVQEDITNSGNYNTVTGNIVTTSGDLSAVNGAVIVASGNFGSGLVNQPSATFGCRS